jgi:hypothetical protein
MQRGRTMYDKPRERQQLQGEGKPRLPHRTLPRSRSELGMDNGHEVRIRLVTRSDAAAEELTPFFELRANGQPQFSAVSLYPEASRSFIGPKGQHIKALERRFPTFASDVKDPVEGGSASGSK